MEYEKDIQKQIVEVKHQNTEEYGIHIPDHAILRLAGFFFEKMRQETENKRE
ncbi:MAG: hypothetical protein IJ945_02745 [Oscillospiraceae bacterium]|nr:hypothetical protein [Oscillospiraceae bacterium]